MISTRRNQGEAVRLLLLFFLVLGHDSRNHPKSSYLCSCIISSALCLWRREGPLVVMEEHTDALAVVDTSDGLISC